MGPDLVLLHGTFAGVDATGLLRNLGLFWPSLARPIRTQQKAMIDHLLGDCGNYPPEYVDQVNRRLCDLDLPRSHRRYLPGDASRFIWSGENHDIGRCAAAIQLAEHLLDHFQSSEREIVLWGHSHGGNVIAILTNLLGADASTLRRLFRKTRSFWGSRPQNRTNPLTWQRLYRRLTSVDRGRLASRLHVVTFGTPVVYGWDESGCRTLMHFIYVPTKDIEEKTWDRLPSFEEFYQGDAGDSVQRLAVAGTEIRPPWLQINARLANRRLARWWHPHGQRRCLKRRLNNQSRLHQSGLNILVDYKIPTERRSLLNAHGVYTRIEFIDYHLKSIASLIEEELRRE